MTHAPRASRFALAAVLGLGLAAGVLASPAPPGLAEASAAEKPGRKAERVVFIVLD